MVTISSLWDLKSISVIPDGFLEEKYKLKVEVLGRGKGKTSEMIILNKVVRMTNEGIELEADPRHAELVVKDLGLTGCKPSMVPGSKEIAKGKIEEDDKPKTRETDGTKARIELRFSDSIHEATNSAGAAEWDESEYDGDWRG